MQLDNNNDLGRQAAADEAPRDGLDLYHGTSSLFLDAILRDGLAPRAVTGGSAGVALPASASWMESAPNSAYVTRTWAPHYACRVSESSGGEPAVLRLRILPEDFERLRPDEDFLAAVFKREAVGLAPIPDSAVMPFHMRALREVERYAHLWFDCLKQMGTIAHVGAIPASRIVGATVLPLSGYDREVIHEIIRKTGSVAPGDTRIGMSTRQDRILRGLTRWAAGEKVQTHELEGGVLVFGSDVRLAVGSILRKKPRPYVSIARKQKRR